MKPVYRSIFLAAICLPSAAFAQSATEADDPPRDVLIVTGTRSPEPIATDRIGGSVTVIGDEMLSHRQVRTISDVLRDVPGIAVSRVPGQTQVRIRGAEGNHTLVLVDGIEVSDPFAGEFDFGTLIADEAARVEVLRGQQSALYGSDAIGGVIHYRTLSGRDAPGTTVRIEAGSFRTVNAAARLAGAAGALDYALSATLDSTDGTPGARGGTRDLSSDTGSLSAKANWLPSANTRLTAVVRYASAEGEFNDSDNDPASPTFGFQIDTPGNRFENEAIYALLRGELGLLDGRWTHALSGQIADTRRDGFNAAGRSFGSEGQRLKTSYESTLRFGDDRLQHRATVAVDIERERFRNTDPSGFAFTGLRQIDSAGLVGQYELFIADAVSVGASLRRDWNGRFADTTTYRVQGSYRVTPATRLRAAAGSGVKNPSFYEMFGFVDGRFIGNVDLEPERSEGWEIGIEQGLFGDSLLLGATYFENELTGEIFTTFPPPDFIASPANRDTISTQRGVEVFATAQFGEAWRVDGMYTYFHARENGVEEVRRPAHTASLAVDWQASGDRGGVTIVARYNGDAVDVAFIDPSFVPVRVALDDYLLLSVNMRYALSESVELFGRIENALDEEYEDVFSFATPGRSAVIGARARF